MSDSKKEKQGKKLIIILLVFIGLLSGAAAFLAKVALFDQKDKIETLQRKSTSTEDRFRRLTGDINKAKELLKSIDLSGFENDTINADLLGADIEAIMAKRKESSEKISLLEGQIQELIAKSDGQANNFSQFKALYAKLKTEVYLLRSEISKLKAKNQALISENAKLKKENRQLGTDLNGANSNIAQLENLRNTLEGKVSIGKRLMAFDKMSEGVKVRRNGEEKSTNRARRADKIRIAFTISKNELAESGELDIFLRVLDEDKRIISDDGNEFNYKSEKLIYTAKETIDYQNAEKDVILYAEKESGKVFSEGLYTVQVYTNSDMILADSFTLK
jgi:chromosome segregation ATPase